MDCMGVTVIRKNGVVEQCTEKGMREIMNLDDKVLHPAGMLTFEHYRDGLRINTIVIDNLVVNEGKQDLLNTYFCSGTQIATASWFMGLLDNSGFTGIVATDTAASHGGWTEFTTYSQSTRPLWGQIAPATGVTTITNTTAATFDITGTGVLKGGFIISNSTKGGTTGKLWAAAPFPSTVSVVNGDQIKVTYSLSS